MLLEISVGSVFVIAKAIRRTSRRLVAAVGILAVVGALGCGKLEGDAKASAVDGVQPEEVLPVDVLELASETFTANIEATGKALPIREGTLSGAISGRVEKILVNEGDIVRKGQVLVRFDSRGFHIGAKQAQAALAAARAASDIAKLELERAIKLSDGGASPQAVTDRANAQVDATTAQLAMAQAQVEQTQKGLSDTELRAPYDATVVAVLRQVGTFATSMPPTELISIVDTSSLEVQAFLPEDAVTAVHLGDTAKVLVGSAGVETTGKVVFVSDRMQTGSQTFEIRVLIENPDRIIKGGAFCRLSLTRPPIEGAVLVPLRAVRRDGKDQPYVFLLEKELVKRVDVTLGDSSGDRVLVRSGLAAGQRLITTTGSDVADGVRATARKI
ncbi:MAG: efflux RND transporter periplasmic adaptor subunit [Myxococcota bacterium]|nr:efflux RND transporter periplasmic adaptor subunit [Myxococcota bacterium]